LLAATTEQFNMGIAKNNLALLVSLIWACANCPAQTTASTSDLKASSPSGSGNFLIGPRAGEQPALAYFQHTAADSMPAAKAANSAPVSGNQLTSETHEKEIASIRAFNFNWIPAPPPQSKFKRALHRVFRLDESVVTSPPGFSGSQLWQRTFDPRTSVWSTPRIPQ